MTYVQATSPSLFGEQHREAASAVVGAALTADSRSVHLVTPGELEAWNAHVTW
jgi:hypothetical protein